MTRLLVPISVVAFIAALAGCGGAAKQPHAASAAPASGPVLLGAKNFLAGRVGWGVAHPRKIDGGGDPALLITDIRWQGWGRQVAVGVGKSPAYVWFKGGSYYPKPVRAELRAYEIGHCRPHGPPTYMGLKVRMPPRPGARPGKWFSWAGAHGLCSYP